MIKDFVKGFEQFRTVCAWSAQIQSTNLNLNLTKPHASIFYWHTNLKNTKALGIDNIATEVWKKGKITLSGPIARLCNVSMATGIVPDLFKKAIVHPASSIQGTW